MNTSTMTIMVLEMTMMTNPTIMIMTRIMMTKPYLGDDDDDDDDEPD